MPRKTGEYYVLKELELHSYKVINEKFVEVTFFDMIISGSSKKLLKRLKKNKDLQLKMMMLLHKYNLPLKSKILDVNYVNGVVDLISKVNLIETFFTLLTEEISRDEFRKFIGEYL